MQKNRVKVITIVSVCLAALWFFGFGWAVQDYYGSSETGLTKKEPASQPKNKESDLTIVALGDSLTRGTGDETGKGYVGLVTQDVKQRYKGNVIVHNLGINGQTSSQLMKQVKQAEVQRQLSSADTVLITIGGNDLFQQGRSLLEFEQENIMALQTQYLSNLKSIINDIRKANKEAAIFMVGLYNPFIELDDGAETSAVVREWNFQTAETLSAFPKTVLVPTFDLFQLSVDDYLYTDKFHPNKEGYRLISERVAPLITWEGQQ
ncbi:SGNH/GDSL hydrolase family protein [Peribacillus sp. SCS-155]|uniref:SGNH/GDSL hydrolase family protein n=1 Tax=Peribacillus sedimenti TaxID=3115297 RepID=UPI003906168F